MPQLCHTLPLALVSLVGFSTETAGDSYQKAAGISRSPSLSRCRISSNLNVTSVVIKPALQRNKTKENILEGALDSIKGLNFSLYYTFSIWLKHGAEYTRILLVV